MRGKAVAALYAYMSRLFCLGIAITTLTFAGCGGGPTGTTNGGTTTTVTSVTVSPATKTITAGDSISFTAAVAGQDNPSQAVVWSVSPATAGTVTAGGAFTSSSTITATTTATIKACSTVPNYTTVCGSATVTIDLPAAQLPTVTITASPSAITIGSTTTLTWSSTNATSCTASGAWSGTEATSGSTTETPAATGTATYTLACTGAGGSATASAIVTVNAAPLPNVTSVSTDTMYVDWAKVLVAGVYLNGTNFDSADTVYATGFNNIASESLVNSTQIALELQFGATGYVPGWLTFAVCENPNDTSCGISQSIAFLGAQNYLATSPSGEILFLDQTPINPSTPKSYVWKYKSDGTADGGCRVGIGGNEGISIDNKTPYFLEGGNVYNATGPNSGDGGCDYTDIPNPQGMPSGTVTANAADNGYAGLVQPANNSASFYDMTGGTGSQPTVYTASNLGTTPWAIAMGTFGTETDAFVVSADGTPSLYKVRASDAYTGEEKPLPLPGITPLSTVVAANILAGGLQVVAFDSGPASGTIAVLSTYDDLLVLVNESTWTITASVKVTGMSGVSGTPFRIVADVTDGAVIVAYANPATVTTTYSLVYASTGSVTPLATTSSLLSVGLGFDGTNIISGMRNQIEIKQMIAGAVHPQKIQ